MNDERHETDDVNEAIAGELRLMDPAVRSSRVLFEPLLDPEFAEVGASGRRYTYEEMPAWLPDPAGSSAGGLRYVPSDITGVLLAPGLVHLTFETVFDGRRARHSSAWRKRDEETGWRMYYHQGTQVPAGIEQLTAPAASAAAHGRPAAAPRRCGGPGRSCGAVRAGRAG